VTSGSSGIARSQSRRRNGGPACDVGYATGGRVAEAYYENTTDKRQAMREILGVTDYPAILEKSGYAGPAER
jgi:SLT domain-containing protein